MTKKISKTKQEKTLKRMKETRKADSVALRNIIEQKLTWALGEKNKGLVQQKKLQTQINRIEGIIIFCQDILAPKETKNDNSKI